MSLARSDAVGQAQRRGTLAGRQAGGGGIEPWDGQAMGRSHGSSAIDARGPFRLDQRYSILARRQAGSVGIGRWDGQAIGRSYKSSAIDAQRLFK